MSEVRGSSRECQAAMAQEWPRGATLRPRSGGTAKRSYPACEVRGGWEELPHAPSPSPGAATGRSNLTPEPRGGSREELPNAPMPKARGSGWEELPYARGQGQRPGGPTPRPGSGGCAGAGGPRGAIPR